MDIYLGFICCDSILPKITAKAEVKINAKDDPRKTVSLLTSLSAANNIVASCVLSPSSAIKITENTVKNILKYPYLSLTFKFLCKSVHHLADISQTSESFRIFLGAITSTSFLFESNLFEDHWVAVIYVIFFNVFPHIFKAIAYQIVILEFVYLWTSPIFPLIFWYMSRMKTWPRCFPSLYKIWHHFFLYQKKHYTGFTGPPKTENNNTKINVWMIQPIKQTPTARSVLL